MLDGDLTEDEPEDFDKMSLFERLNRFTKKVIVFFLIRLETAKRLLETIPAGIVRSGDSGRLSQRIDFLLGYRLGRISLLSLLQKISEKSAFSNRDQEFAHALELSVSGQVGPWIPRERVRLAVLLCEVNFNETDLLRLWIDQTFLSQLTHGDFLNLRGISTGALYRLGCFEAGFSLSVDTATTLDLKLDRRSRLWGETTLFHAIGHLALLHFLLLATQQGLVSPQDIVLVRGNYTVANSPYADWLERWAKRLGVQINSADNHSSPAEPSLDVWPVGGTYVTSWHHQGRALSKATDSVGGVNRDKQLEFDTNIGLDLLCRLGWDSGSPTVGFHIRNDQAQDRSMRNSNPKKFFPSMARLVREGYNVVLLGELKRQDTMGLPKNVLIASQEANKFSRDAINLAVWQKSQFFVGNVSGGTHPSGAFHTPTLLVDQYPITSFRAQGPQDLFQLKLPFSLHDGRFLKLKEVFHLKHRWSQTEDPRLLARAGYSAREVCTEEVDEGVREMQARANGLTPRLSGHQDQVNSIYKSHGFLEGGSISPSFLQKWLATLL